MHERDMRAVDAALDRLRPVAMLPPLGDGEASFGCLGPFENREWRLFFGRPHIDPDRSARDMRGVGGGLDLVLVGRAVGLGRHIDAIAFDVEFPAMIGTADPAFFVAPVVEMGAAVRAIGVEDPDPSVAVAKRDQLLAQQTQLLGRTIGFGQLLFEQRGHPETAQHFAHRGARSDPGQRFILLFGEHGVVSLWLGRTRPSARQARMPPRPCSPAMHGG